MKQNISIPAIYCPFSSAISPFADTLQKRTLEWVLQFELVSGDQAWRRLQKSKFGRLAARAYPNAPLDRLEIVAAWNTWLFVLDDHCDESGLGKDPQRLGLLHDRCLEILTGSLPVADDPALVHAIYDIRIRIEPLMPLSWLTRFVQSAAEYFESTQWEAKNRQFNLWPESETYIRMRPYTGGLLTDIDLIELTESIILPLTVRTHPVITEFIEITNNVVCWSNDIISLQKEYEHQDMHNLVLVIEQQYSIGIQEAVNQVAIKIEQQVRRFIQLQQSLPLFEDSADKDVEKCVNILCAWMRGNLDWSFESRRYLPADVTNAYLTAKEKNKAAIDIL